VLTVIPVTSNTLQVYPFQVLLPSADTGLQQNSKAQAEQIRSVAIQRIGDQVGRMPPTLMSQLDEALRLHLELLRAMSSSIWRYGSTTSPASRKPLRISNPAASMSPGKTDSGGLSAIRSRLRFRRTARMETVWTPCGDQVAMVWSCLHLGVRRPG
jgi:PemK-like, MazF-like toxin of type II toxin-antitoxin system